jgi:hypothetical protein
LVLEEIKACPTMAILKSNLMEFISTWQTEDWALELQKSYNKMELNEKISQLDMKATLRFSSL